MEEEEVLFVKILILVLLAIPIVVSVIAGIVVAAYLALRKRVVKVKGTKKPEIAAKKEATEKKAASKPKKDGGSKSIWKLCKPILFTGLVVWAGFSIYFGAYRHFFFPSGSARSMGFSQDSTLLTVEAPVGNFDNEKSIPEGIYFSWGDSTDSFIVKDQKGATAKYDPKNGVLENLPYPSKTLVFKSLGDKPAIVKLRLSKTPLVKM
jgi:hypothetical protein